MFVEFGLSLYYPRAGRVAHVVKTYPDTSELYIFCNRFLGAANGRIVAPADVADALEQGASCCVACMTALEATLERVAVLKGKRPPALALDAGEE